MQCIENHAILHGVVDGHFYVKSILRYVCIIIQRNDDETVFCYYTLDDSRRQKVLRGKKKCTNAGFVFAHCTQHRAVYLLVKCSHVLLNTYDSAQLLIPLLLCQHFIVSHGAEMYVSLLHFSSRNTADFIEKSVIKAQGSKFIDTGGGFLLEEEADDQDDGELV
jgi:hypothetical protein